MNSKSDIVFFKILAISFLFVLLIAFFGYYLWKISLGEKILFSAIIIGTAIMIIFIFQSRFKNDIRAIFQIWMFGMVGFILIVTSIFEPIIFFYRLIMFIFGIMLSVCSILLFLNNFKRKVSGHTSK